MLYIICEKDGEFISVNLKRLEIVAKEAWGEEIEDADTDVLIPEIVHHDAVMRDETDAEMIARIGMGGFVHKGELPQNWKIENGKPVEIQPVVSKDDVNAEISDNLAKIWGGTDQTHTALKHQNAVGIMGRLVNKIVAEEAVLTADEEAIKDGIKAQLEAHEAVLKEGRRLKALSPIPSDFKELLAAIQRP